MRVVNFLRKIKSRFVDALSVALRRSFVYRKELFDYHRLTFSQEGEDRLLERLLPNTEVGFYVDIGAHHPQRFSNTYKFYLAGWRGINIDPMPNIMKKFDEIRPRDINLELGIASKEGTLTYYIFDEPALNTFDEDCALSRKLPIIAKKRVRVRTLADVFNEYIAPNQVIDFLSVDVEGLDLNVLQSNDWESYRPTYILAESLETDSVKCLIDTEINLYMSSIGYRLVAKLFNTVVFKDCSSQG